MVRISMSSSKAKCHLLKAKGDFMVATKKN